MLMSCSSGDSKSREEIPCDNYKAAMREFVQKISTIGRSTNPKFIVIPQNGQNVAWDDDENPVPDSDFFAAIDGTGREDVFYGMNASYDIADGFATPQNISEEIQEMCDVYTENGKTVLATDYTTSDSAKISASFTKNSQKNYVSFAATQRALNEIPTYSVHNENSADVKKLSDAKNFLYLINPANFSAKEAFVDALCNTNYDAFIIDLYCADKMLTSSDLAKLKVKKNGGKRIVICYMSIGEAEDYRWYWKNWNKYKPDFLEELNVEWEGNYKVRYWYPQWQEIICGTDGYLSKILNAGFDGVYLDIIDAFEYFENQ